MTLLHWAAPTVTRPTRLRKCPTHFGLSAREPKQGKFPPFVDGAPPADSSQPVVSRQGRCSRGGSLAPRVSLGTWFTTKGSPQRQNNGKEDNGGEAVISSVDKRLPEWNRESMSSRGWRGTSRYSCLGRMLIGNDSQWSALWGRRRQRTALAQWRRWLAPHATGGCYMKESGWGPSGQFNRGWGGRVVVLTGKQRWR
jgi:hypothetical protein